MERLFQGNCGHDQREMSEIKACNSVYLVSIRDPDARCGCHTYLGACKNPIRRWRQHRGDLVGGAVTTHRKRTSVRRRFPTHDWEPLVLVSGFSTWSLALQFERFAKHNSLAKIIKECKSAAPIKSSILHARSKIMLAMLSLPKWIDQGLRVQLFSSNTHRPLTRSQEESLARCLPEGCHLSVNCPIPTWPVTRRTRQQQDDDDEN